MKKIAFLDDHKLYTGILADFVKSKFDEVEVEIFDQPSEFIYSYAGDAYDIIIIDLEMPEMSGVEVIKEIRKVNLEQKVMVLSMFYNIQIAYELRKLGVLSFLPKNTDTSEFELAIKKVMENQEYFKEEFAVHEVDAYLKKKQLITRRELEIIKYSAEGKTSLELADKLFISEGTVRTHIKNIMAKMGANSFKAVIANYQKEGWKVLT